jgi:hypothetical protein
MFWVDVGIAVFAGIAGVLASLIKRPRDLGLISDQWLAEHRRE